MRSRIAAVVNIALLCAVVTSGAFALGTPQRAAACDCAAFTDTEAYEFADVVFTGTLVEISGPGPFVVFARLDDDGNARGAVEGEVYSNLCSGTRLLADGALPTSFGTPSPPVTVAATGEASSPPASSANGSSGDGLWIAAIVGVLVLGAGGAIALRRHGRNGATSSRTAR